MIDLNGKVALVTGSGQGIGCAIALKLSEQGAAVIVNDLADSPHAPKVAAEIQAKDRKARFVPADISKSSEVNSLVETAIATYGRVDILVNNAGITRDALLLRMSEEDWDRVLNINLRGAFLCTKAVLRQMVKQRWGRVINIASVVGVVGNAGQANYAASKGGLIAFTKAVAYEVATRNITVNAIAPGFIETEMTLKLDQSIQEAILGRIPQGRFGSAEDVANVAAFLASEEARYITGHVLSVNGGMTMV